MTQHTDDDAFTAYVVTRLLPFLKKYRMLLAAAGIVLLVLFIVMGIMSVQSRGNEKETLDGIYTSLTKSKEITVKTLEDLNAQYGKEDASLEVKWRLAGKYTEQEDYEKAGKIYREIMDQFEGSPTALTSTLALGTCLEHRKKYPDAVALYENGRQQYKAHMPIQAYFLYRKAAALHFSGDRAAAEQAAAEAIVLLESPAEDDNLKAMHESFINKLKDKADFLRNMSRRKPAVAVKESTPEEAPEVVPAEPEDEKK